MKVGSAFVMQVTASVLPSIALLLVVPVVRRYLGLDQFASFTVLVSSISVLSILDGGLGRATTYFVSKASVQNEARSRDASIWAGLLLGFFFSLVITVAAATILASGPAGSLKGIHRSLMILIPFCPAFVLGSVLKGVLEGQRRFFLSTSIQLLYGCMISLAPLIMVYSLGGPIDFSRAIGVIRLLFVGALLASIPISASFSRHLLPAILEHSAQIFRYSRWLVVSNIVGLCVVFADRFVIAEYFDARTVGSYMLPMEMVSRAQLLVGAFCSVIFPALVMQAQRKNADYFEVIKAAQGVIASAVWIIGCLGVPLAEPLFGWWLGSELGSQAAQIALIAVIGMALIASASIAMVAINSLGHTRQVAMVHVLEIVIYVPLLYVAAHLRSLIILLLAWLLRQLIDALFMSKILKGLTESAVARPTASSTSRTIWIILTGMYGTYLLFAFKLSQVSIIAKIYVSGAGIFIGIGIFLIFLYRFRTYVAGMREVSRL
jgi:O-antigen/teichoic acid export membrane protein